ncbi:hypothetical protein rosmuc_00099 [Roseovarius mucosus DSM 17069]|uniref:Uncharacterized protein n=2 Tax=Roseovarius mucosus TaxID=215743 RepID=A0A0A0HTU7_9RHOB|nr:hypothetical protein rosmuc_00099 [Roseovarius mucosus DSM 17069]
MDKNWTSFLNNEDTLSRYGFCIFASTGTPDKLIACTVSEAASILREKPDSNLSVLYRPPVQALGAELSASASTADALTGWTKVVASLLQLQRKYRRRMSFFEAPDEENPNLEAKAAFGEAVKSTALPKCQNWSARAKTFEPLAALLLDLDITTRELAEELKAATRGGFIDTPDNTEALEALASALSAQLISERQAQETIIRLEADLQELATLSERCPESQGQVEELHTELENEKHIGSKLQEQVVDLEAALLALDRDHQNAVLEMRVIESAKQDLETEYQRRVEELTYALQSVYTSTSWRITAPARAIIRLFRR